MKVLGVLTWLVMAVLGSAMLNSWALSKLWLWFVSAQYGSGPTLAAWFGLAQIAQLVLVRDDLSKSTDGEDGAITKMVSGTIGRWIGVLLALGVSWLCGIAIGWVR